LASTIVRALNHSRKGRTGFLPSFSRWPSWLLLFGLFEEREMNTTMASHDYPMLTATEALAQGASPSTFFSIARFNTQNNPDVARRARRVAVELADLTGADVGGRRRANNDNGPRRSKRRAA
jgi:hypothetical protein